MFECVAPEPMYDMDADAGLFAEAAECFSVEPDLEMGSLFECESPVAEMPAPVMRAPMPSPAASAPKQESGADKVAAIRRNLERDTLLHLGEAPAVDALKDCLDVVKALIKQVTEALRIGALAEQPDRWREFLSKLMDYQEALEHALESGSIKPARQLRKELAAMLRGS